MVVAALVAMVGCSDPTGAAAVRVTLEVLRGPIAPVCTPDVVCTAPFAGSFDLYRFDEFRRLITTGSDGRLELLLAPGRYALVPAPGAPGLTLGSQRKEFAVTEPGPLTIRLEFDTGIR